MGRCNGFLTAYVLWLGVVILAVTTGAAGLSQLYIMNARHYAEAIRLDYAAESLLIAEWDAFTETSWRDVPRKRRLNLEDTYGVANPGDVLEIYITSNNPQALPFTGFLRTAVENPKTKQKRSCGIRFSVESGIDGKESQYIIVEQHY